jgi:membrane fusion protein, multidrug efflux system
MLQNILLMKNFTQNIITNKGLQRKFVIIAIVVIIGLALVWWLHSLRFVSTENAYVNANIVEVSSRVSGQVAHVSVENNQYVKIGAMLFQLDPAPFKVAVTKAQAQLALNVAEWQNAQANSKRTLVLVKVKALSQQAEDDQLAKLQTSQAAVEMAKASLAQAELDLQYAQVNATTNGWVTNLNLRDGNVVTANQPLFAIVSNAKYWIDANFKETELQHIHPGQKTTIKIDMYPGHKFIGTVESISNGSGTAFSLLPPQNAAGNWVKVTQRVPVKIRVDNPDQQFPLRVGTTATVTIDTHS